MHVRIFRPLKNNPTMRSFERKMNGRNMLSGFHSESGDAIDAIAQELKNWFFDEKPNGALFICSSYSISCREYSQVEVILADSLPSCADDSNAVRWIKNRINNNRDIFVCWIPLEFEAPYHWNFQYFEMIPIFGGYGKPKIKLHLFKFANLNALISQILFGKTEKDEGYRLVRWLKKATAEIIIDRIAAGGKA